MMLGTARLLLPPQRDMRRDPTKLMSTHWALNLYHLVRKWFPLSSLAIFFVLFIINAPFGRFASAPTFIPWFSMPSYHFNGVSSWIFMELVSPFTFAYAFLISPLTFYTPSLPSLDSPQAIFCILFFAHYANRALINPLRTHSRSTIHLSVILFGVAYNLCNGYLLGSYFSSPLARMYLGTHDVYQRTSFWVGIALWGIGFVGNVVHDEILLEIRRKARARQEKEKDESKKEEGKKGEHYGIPQGLLYNYISYPNYFCEWVEWFGFALAASPPPFELSYDVFSPAAFASSVMSILSNVLSPKWWTHVINTPPLAFAPTLTPPWIFVLTEVAVMFPRAYKGHMWYKEKFGESYPKNRKAVIPFIA